jgi:hypothetical protein
LHKRLFVANKQTAAPLFMRIVALWLCTNARKPPEAKPGRFNSTACRVPTAQSVDRTSPEARFYAHVIHSFGATLQAGLGKPPFFPATWEL